jgi:hypothetical protein
MLLISQSDIAAVLCMDSAHFVGHKHPRHDICTVFDPIHSLVKVFLFTGQSA